MSTLAQNPAIWCMPFPPTPYDMSLPSFTIAQTGTVFSFHLFMR